MKSGETRLIFSPRWTLMTLTLILFLAQSGSGEINSANKAFLQPGDSYQGKTATTRLQNTASSVAVLGKNFNCVVFPDFLMAI